LIYPLYPHIAAILPWKTSQVHNDNCQSYQPKLHITVQSKTASSLSVQSVRVQV